MPSRSAPASAWARAIAAYRSRVASLSTEPSSASTPQCPWSVNSSRHRSAISTVSPPTSEARSASATLRMPAGSDAADPTASRSAGMPNTISPPTPASTASTAAALSVSLVCCTTPGHRRDRRRRVQALFDEHRQHQIGGMQPGLGHQPAQCRGAPQSPGPARRVAHRRLLCSRAAASAAISPSSVGSVGDHRRQPRPARRLRGRLAEGQHHGVGGRRVSANAPTTLPAVSTTASYRPPVRSAATLAGRRNRLDEVGADPDDPETLGGEQLGQGVGGPIPTAAAARPRRVRRLARPARGRRPILIRSASRSTGMVKGTDGRGGRRPDDGDPGIGGNRRAPTGAPRPLGDRVDRVHRREADPVVVTGRQRQDRGVQRRRIGRVDGPRSLRPPGRSRRRRPVR